MGRRIYLQCFTLLILFFSITINEIIAQNRVDSLAKKHFNRYYLYAGITYTASMFALNELWYKDYPKSSFHTFNDNAQWLQVDKVGHSYSAFTLAKLNYAILSGNENKEWNKKAAIVGSMSSYAFLTTIEIFDGYSENWGFSWGDVTANTIGVGLFLGQQLLFEKQILQLKYSYHSTEYRENRPNVLGDDELQGAFKDYNGQTYWASLNLNGVYNQIKPKWLNLAFGYGGEGMLYASDNVDSGSNNTYRQYYLSLDVDFERIETNHKWLKSVFKVANCIKVPFPTLELKEGGKTDFNWLYF